MKQLLCLPEHPGDKAAGFPWEKPDQAKSREGGRGCALRGESDEAQWRTVGAQFLPFVDDENAAQMMKITLENLLWLSIAFFLPAQPHRAVVGKL